MAINIVDNLNIYAPKSIDNRYLKNGTVPYTSVNDVLASIEPSVRHIGLTVLINNEEYWFKNGVTNNDLILKSSGSISGNTFGYIELTNDPFIFEPFISQPVFFEKENYGDQVDEIDTDIAITRGNNQGIYNPYEELNWNNNEKTSPLNTLWNSDGWGNLRAIKQRTYTTFYNAVGGNLGENILGIELIMFDTINNKYYAIKFSSWTQNNLGGGFSYTRQLINSSDLFVKPDNDVTTIDIFIEDDGQGSGIGITRANNQGIYNPYREEEWDNDISPSGTLWNINGWNDLSDILIRDYQPLYAAFGSGGLGNKVVGTECIMYIPEIEKYYAIKFTDWTQNSNGGGFSYLRYEIDKTKLNEGIKFADGSVLKSAEGIGKIKATFSGGRRIEEQTGYIQVDVTQAVVGSPVNGTIYQDNNGSFDFYVVHTPELETLYDNQNSFTKLEFSFDQQITWKETVFGGGSRGNWWQFFFPNSEPADYVTVLSGQTVSYRVTTGGQPVRWFNAEGENFRGAIINFHAYSTDSGTIIGTIHIADDSGDDVITHTETKSGGTNIDNVDMWLRIGNEREIFFRRLDGEQATLKIQWIAKMFYGNEFYD